MERITFTIKHSPKDVCLMTFEDAVSVVLSHEGGYSNHPEDPGSETKYGISKRQYPNLDIANLTIEKATSIYRIDYWNASGAHLLPESLRLMVLDCSVLQGVPTAVRFVQRCLGVKADGHIGPITRAAIADLDEMDFLDKYSKMRLERLATLPHWHTFGAGWAKRLLDVTLICAFIVNVKARKT